MCIAQEELRLILLKLSADVSRIELCLRQIDNLRRPTRAAKKSGWHRKDRSRPVRLDFQCIMREGKLFRIGHDSHLVPVIRKFLAAFEANYIGARQVRGTGTALPPLYALRESCVQVPAAEQQIE